MFVYKNYHFKPVGKVRENFYEISKKNKKTVKLYIKVEV